MRLSYMCACVLMCFLLNSMVGIGAMEFEAYANPTQPKARVLSSSITCAAHTRPAACTNRLLPKITIRTFKVHTPVRKSRLVMPGSPKLQLITYKRYNTSYPYIRFDSCTYLLHSTHSSDSIHVLSIWHGYMAKGKALKRRQSNYWLQQVYTRICM